MTKDIRFHKKNIFYDEKNKASEDFENFINESEIKKFWSFENDFLLNVHSRRNWSSESEEIQVLMTSKSLLKDNNDDESINESDEIEKEKNFADAIDLQFSSLFENVISENIMFALQQTQSMRKSFSDEQLQAAQEEYTDELINESAETASDIASISENIISSTNSSWKHNKDFASIAVDRSTRFKTNKLSSIDYKKSNDSERRLKKRVNYFNNLYYICQEST